jgi:microcystin-dependent protein
MANTGAYQTPEFSPSDPLVCHELALRPSLWAVVFNSLEELGERWSWRQDDPAHATIDEVILEINKATDNAIFTGCTMIGEIKRLATATIPDWCLICDGASYLDADYPELGAVIHANYRIDATHFRVPDYIGNFDLGNGTPGNAGGEAEHTLSVGELPSHRHTQDQFGSAPSVVLGELAGFEIAPVAGFTGFTGGDQPHNNMPPYETSIPVIVARRPNA